jgi:hypothetical protein
MHTFKYKADPYKATDKPHAHQAPTLTLYVDRYDQPRKRIFVRTRQNDIPLVLCYNGKKSTFELRKFTPLGNIGAVVYNNWELTEDVYPKTKHW